MKKTFSRVSTYALCLLILLSSVSCKQGTNDPDHSTVPESASEEVSLSPEQLLTAERTEYLSGIEFPHFALTGKSEPYYVGRWFTKTIFGSSHKVTLTDGAHLYFLVENADSFQVNFTVITSGTEPHFAYSIDGAEPIRQNITKPTVKLPDNGRHTVCIIADGLTETERKWEKEIGFALKSITLPEGGTMAGIRPTDPVIFFYGDSITEGVRALNMRSDSDGNSATHAYPWYCSQVLGAIPYFIGYGGSGIVKNGSFSTMINAIDYLSQNRGVSDGVVPDIIVVNHGTNDVYVSQTQFEQDLKKTLTRLREKYPYTPIVYLIPFNQTFASTITQVTNGIRNTYVIQTHTWNITYTDGLHPDAAGAKTAGENLAEELRKQFGEMPFLPKT